MPSTSVSSAIAVEKQQYFWTMPVYNFATEGVEIWQVTQKGVRDQLAALQANEDWGDPTGKYTITISKKGEGLDTKYNVTPNPAEKDTEAITAAMESYSADPMDLEAMFFKSNEPS